jgi:hypothetical protein
MPSAQSDIRSVENRGRGIHIARVATIPWEDRINVDNWPSQAGMYHHDPANQFTLRLINYPLGSTEPRHVHAGSHATTVLRGRAIVDGLSLGPLDVILGPSNEPHGPLHYPEGCKLLSAFQGSYFHSEVGELSGEPQYRLIQANTLPWAPDHTLGCQKRTLVDRGLGRLKVEVLAFAGKQCLDLPPSRPSTAFLVLDGSVSVAGEARPLGEWDFLYLDAGGEPTSLDVSTGTTLLSLALR